MGGARGSRLLVRAFPSPNKARRGEVRRRIDAVLLLAGEEKISTKEEVAVSIIYNPREISGSKGSSRIPPFASLFRSESIRENVAYHFVKDEHFISKESVNGNNFTFIAARITSGLTKNDRVPNYFYS